MAGTVADFGLVWCCQIPMAFALFHGGFIAIHVFRQDVLVAQVSHNTARCIAAQDSMVSA